MTTAPSAITLRSAIDTYGHTLAIKSGTAKIPGVIIDSVEVQPIIAAFRRMVRGLEFDLCEMAITTYMTAVAYGKPLVALPVFLIRLLNHSAMSYNVRSGIEQPSDVAGKRVGVRAYTVTQGVWCRGLLATEYGVDLDSVTWVLVDEEHVAEFKYPPNVVTAPKGATLGELLTSGAIDAAIGAGKVESPDIRPLIPDAAVAEEEWSRRVGFTPINHMLVLKRDVYESNPWLARALFEAFTLSKIESLRRITDEGSTTASDRQIEHLATLGAGDPLPFGVEPNRKALETIVDHAYHQHILPHRYALEEIFVSVD